MPDQGLGVGAAVLAVGWTLLPFSLAAVALRVFTKLRIVRRRLSVDDFLIALALLIQALYNFVFTLAVHYGLGQPMTSLSPDVRSEALKYIVLSEPLAVLSSMFGRAGFALYLLALLGPGDAPRRYALVVIVVLQVVANMATVVQILAQCGAHITALWNQDSAAHCQSPEVETLFGYVQSSINSACDLALTVIPLLVLRKLQLSVRVKLGLAGLLCLSLFAFVASVIKAVAIANLSKVENFSYSMAWLVICCTVENNLVVIGASIPTLKPLMVKVSGTATGYATGGSSKRAARWKSESTRDLRSGTGTITRKTDVTVVLEEMDGRGRVRK